MTFRVFTGGTKIAIELVMIDATFTVWTVNATFEDGTNQILIAYVEEKDARLAAERCSRQPYDDVGNPLLSPAEMLWIKGVSVRPLMVRGSRPKAPSAMHPQLDAEVVVK
jgi:hypothetical protein